MSDPHDCEIKKELLKFMETRNENDLETFIRTLNKHYSTRLSNGDIHKLSKLDDKIIDKIIKGDYVYAVDSIRKICDKDILSFATKFVYFVSDEKSPIFDKYVYKAIINRGYTGKRNFKDFFQFMDCLSKELGKNFHDIDDFLLEEGRKLEKTKSLSSRKDTNITNRKKNNTERQEEANRKNIHFENLKNHKVYPRKRGKPTQKKDMPSEFFSKPVKDQLLELYHDEQFSIELVNFDGKGNWIVYSRTKMKWWIQIKRKGREYINFFLEGKQL
jgi:hypothetical protein